jgi:FkbM family methyltransferase
MEKINYSPNLTRKIINKGLLSKEPFYLVDVGASGGIHNCWKAFDESLRAYGFEPLIAECDRLNKQKTPNVSYHSCNLIAEESEVHDQSGPPSHQFTRTSASKAISCENYIKKHFNNEQEVYYSNEKTSLNRFFTSIPTQTIDFIKIDTDGHDFEVLYGAKELLGSMQVIGVEVEVQFHGNSHCYSNTFRNIDRFLTDHGFSLFTLDTWKYSKQDLPGLFTYRIPAQTQTGQIMFGDALYLRDCCGKNKNFFHDIITGKQYSLSITKLLKLLCLYEIYCLPDCAAELLNVFKDEFALLIDVQDSLNLLAKDMGFNRSYDQHIKKFEQDFKSFYPKPLTNFFFKLLKN